MVEVLPSDDLVEDPSKFGALVPGTRLGRYELLVPIARGGMARVWAARLHGQRGFQKLVAVKVILPHLAEEAEFERMFLDEARIASGVHHPNVCEIYELAEEKKTLYLVMEWVSGDSFARILRSSGTTEPVDPRVVGRVIADACAGVHAAHELTDDDGRELGVVHRDLSPHNILITADGTAKVCDFGVAKALGQLHEATSAGQLKGKIAYMAPEQITGAAVDRRSDVFSLGCVLYEATTGVRPFQGDGDHQVMHAVLKGDVARPTSLMRGYPQELERVVMRALSPQPILRFPTAERMRFALEEYLAHGQVVTQSNVAQVLRARIGDLIDRRKERIRQASTAGDREAGWTEPPGNLTPSEAAQGGHRSGVKTSQSLAGAPQGRPREATLQMDRPQSGGHSRAGTGEIVPTPPMGSPQSVQPGSVPLAPARSYPPQTSHSHPGASYPGAARPDEAKARPSQHDGLTRPPSGAFDDEATAMMPQVVVKPLAVSLPPVAPNAPASGPPGTLGSAAPLRGPHGAAAWAPAGALHYAMAVGVGILLAALIGLGGFLFWKGRQPHGALHGGAPTATATASGGSHGDGAGGGALASAQITFVLTPPDATLSVEGHEVAAGVRTVPRPESGKAVKIVVRAKGYEDGAVLLDSFTPSPVSLALNPSIELEIPAADAAMTVPAASDVKDPAKDPPRKPVRSPKEPALPANPY